MIGSMPALADLIVSGLRRAGVATLFGVPGGGTNLDLIEAAGREGLPFVLTGTETAGAIAAVAQAEVTGRPGACLTTLGPGVAAAVNGIACGYLDRAPLLVFTDSHAEMFAHQRLDHRALLAPVTKWSAALTASTAAETLDRAIAIATAAPNGPVHLDCPADGVARDFSRPSSSDDASSAVDGLPGFGRVSAGFSRRVKHARRPLLLIGLAARCAADSVAIRGFCDRRGIPAMVTYKAKGVVPDDHPMFAGVFTNAAIEEPLLEQADLLIGLGLDPVELIPRVWQRAQSIVYLGPYPVETRHVPFAAQWIGPITECLELLDADLESTEWKRDAIRKTVDDQRRHVAHLTAASNVASADAARLTPQDVVCVAAERLRGSARVTVDAGAHMFPATMLWPVAEPNDMLISNGLSTMGFALPAAIGAALGDRGRPVVALTGDGGLLMCAAELLTASRERLPVIVIVFSDASLSLIEIKQQQRSYERAGVALGSISWPALAGSFGVPASCATTRAELVRCVEQALERRGPSLIEAKIDRSNYGRMLAAVRG